MTTTHKKNTYNAFWQTLCSYNNIGVVSHIRPDFDCIGAQTVLIHALKQTNKNVIAFNQHDLSTSLKYISGNLNIIKGTLNDYQKCDCFLFIDGNYPYRFGDVGDYAEKNNVPIFCIDHHPGPWDGFNDIIIEEYRSSCCEIVYDFIISTHHLNVITPIMAKALYCGIIGDTGNLSHGKCSPYTLEVMSKLIGIGQFSCEEISKNLYARSMKETYLLGEALSKITLENNNQVACLIITQEMLKKYDCTPENCEGFEQNLLKIRDTKIGIFLCELSNNKGLKISLRSRQNIPINQIANSFGGGGHQCAAAARTQESMDSVIDKLIRMTKEVLACY